MLPTPNFLCPHRTRVARFVLVGAFAGSLQLGLLAPLLRFGWSAALANSVAFLLSAQANFALSHTFTWGDRKSTGSLPARWLTFHGSILGSALLNLLVFAALRPVLPVMAAAAAGIGAGALMNFFANDRLTFRARPLYIARDISRKDNP